MGTRDDLREALYNHSDHRACRLVWEAEQGTSDAASVDTRDYLEVARVTDGTVCLVASEDEADLYVRWNGSGANYIYVAFWPPWGVVDAGTADRDTALSMLAERTDPDPVHFEETPFANDGPAADLTGWL